MLIVPSSEERSALVWSKEYNLRSLLASKKVGRGLTVSIANTVQVPPIWYTSNFHGDIQFNAELQQCVQGKLDPGILRRYSHVYTSLGVCEQERHIDRHSHQAQRKQVHVTPAHWTYDHS